MNAQDLYMKLGMDEFFLGDSFIVERCDADSDILNEINKICISENFKSLFNQWAEINFIDCSELLVGALNYDLAYSRCQIMPIKQAEYFRDQIFSAFKNTGTRCFTNWRGNPWKSENGGGFIQFTGYTFDMAIILVDDMKICFTYFLSED